VFEVGQRIIKEHQPLFRAWTGPVADINLTCPEHIEVSGCLFVNLKRKHLGRGSVSECVVPIVVIVTILKYALLKIGTLNIPAVGYIELQNVLVFCSGNNMRKVHKN
jgi:hypothetical protein